MLEEFKNYLSGYVKNLVDPAVRIGEALGLLKKKGKYADNDAQPLNIQV